MAEVTDIVERVARAISDCAAKAVDQNVGEPYYHHIARAALAAMLEAVGEPVAWYREGPRTGLRVLFDTDPTRSGPATPLYSLAALREALPPPPQD